MPPAGRPRTGRCPRRASGRRRARGTMTIARRAAPARPRCPRDARRCRGPHQRARSASLMSASRKRSSSLRGSTSVHVDAERREHGGVLAADDAGAHDGECRGRRSISRIASLSSMCRVVERDRRRLVRRRAGGDQDVASPVSARLGRRPRRCAGRRTGRARARSSTPWRSRLRRIALHLGLRTASLRASSFGTATLGSTATVTP